MVESRFADELDMLARSARMGWRADFRRAGPGDDPPMVLSAVRADDGRLVAVAAVEGGPVQVHDPSNPAVAEIAAFMAADVRAVNERLERCVARLFDVDPTVRGVRLESNWGGDGRIRTASDRGRGYEPFDATAVAAFVPAKTAPFVPVDPGPDDEWEAFGAFHVDAGPQSPDFERG